MKPKQSHAADEDKSQSTDFCQTPPYALDPMLPYLRDKWVVWDPAAGEGHLADALHDGGHIVCKSDILTGKNFFGGWRPGIVHAQVTNPPYTLKYKWLDRSYESGIPFALLVPVEVFGAAHAQVLFEIFGYEVMWLDQRVDFKMPTLGWKGQAQFPVCWVCHNILPEPVMYGHIKVAKRKFQEKMKIGPFDPDRKRKHGSSRSMANDEAASVGEPVPLLEASA